MGVESLAVTEYCNNDCEPDDSLGGCNCHDEKHRDLAAHRAVNTRKRHEGKVHGVEHQLDRHQDDDQISPRQDTDNPDREHERAKNQVLMQRHH